MRRSTGAAGQTLATWAALTRLTKGTGWARLRGNAVPDTAYSVLHPVVAQWADEHLGPPTLPQAQALPLADAGRNLLICSPTGTGKTLAAFLPVMSRLAELRDRDELYPRTIALYISPLRALGYDVEHNLRRPLREMGLLERPNSERATMRRGRIREGYVRTGVRTGDTPVEERRQMIARPPHILITTPESLALMIAMPSYRDKLPSLETVIVDEVHALAANKRGSQLALVLESLEEIVRQPLRRVGLSATVAPLERVARYLVGTERDCAIVDARNLRELSVRVIAPFAGATAPLPQIARTAVGLAKDVRTTLVFTNVRSQAERLAHAMEEAGEPAGEIEVPGEVRENAARDRRIGVHHSALERNVRHRVEAQLRAGTLRTVVCSTSLELGVDVGYIDRVLIVGGARGMTPTLQRVGRSGHRPGAIAEGIVLAQDRDDVIEAAATTRRIHDGTVEAVAIPEAPLDVLAQWLVGMVCYERRLSYADALAIARRAAPYADLSEADLRACAAYLSGGGVGADEAHVRRLGADDDGIYGLGRDVCAAYFENVGTIPDEASVTVSARGEAIGRLDAGFAADLVAGDVFLLNGRTFRVKETGTTGIRVEAHVGRPNVPQWSSHLKGISVELAAEIAVLRSGVAERLRTAGTEPAFTWLQSRYALARGESAHAVRYIAQQIALSALPTPTAPVIEVYRMEGRQTVMFHTGAGRRVNETLARIAGARVASSYRINTKLTTDDGGFMLVLPPRRSLPDAVWPQLLRIENFDADLFAGLRRSSILRTHFRYVANTGLLVLRRAAGRRVRAGAQSWSSERIFERLMAADPQFPLVRETLRVVTRDLLDAPAALAYLAALEPDPRVIHPRAATPFSFGILTSSFADTIVGDDRSAMVEALHERVLALLGEDGAASQAHEPQLDLTLLG